MQTTTHVAGMENHTASMPTAGSGESKKQIARRITTWLRLAQKAIPTSPTPLK